MSSIEKLIKIIRFVFDDEDVTIDRNTTANDVEGWDSLSHTNLIVAVESAFAIRFSKKELLSFKNVGDLLDCIDRKISC